MIIRVRVIPESRREEVQELTPDHLIIRVKEKAEDNRVNNRLINLLAARFEVLTRDVRIVTGPHATSKLFDIKKEET